MLPIANRGIQIEADNLLSISIEDQKFRSKNIFNKSVNISKLIHDDLRRPSKPQAMRQRKRASNNGLDDLLKSLPSVIDREKLVFDQMLEEVSSMM
jgi:hypothetical protein